MGECQQGSKWQGVQKFRRERLRITVNEEVFSYLEEADREPREEGEGANTHRVLKHRGRHRLLACHPVPHDHMDPDGHLVRFLRWHCCLHRTLGSQKPFQCCFISQKRSQSSLGLQSLTPSDSCCVCHGALPGCFFATAPTPPAPYLPGHCPSSCFFLNA